MASIDCKHENTKLTIIERDPDTGRVIERIDDCVDCGKEVVIVKPKIIPLARPQIR